MITLVLCRKMKKVVGPKGLYYLQMDKTTEHRSWRLYQLCFLFSHCEKSTNSKLVQPPPSMTKIY